MSLENLFSRNLVNRKTVFFSTFRKVHTKLYIIERSDETKSQPIWVVTRWIGIHQLILARYFYVLRARQLTDPCLIVAGSSGTADSTNSSLFTFWLANLNSVVVIINQCYG